MLSPVLNTNESSRRLSAKVSLSAVALGVAVLSGCADRPLRTPDVNAAIRAELPPAPPAKPANVPLRVSDALAEPGVAVQPAAPEARLDLLVNNAQARDVFLAIVADTRYSMLMHPDVKGTLSVTLRGVTVTEALEAIRDVYGYDFRIDGRRITVYAPTLQTRVFSVNYPTSQRTGNSETRVSSGSSQANGNGNGNGSPGSPAQSSNNNASVQMESSKVATASKSDFWQELAGAVRGMLGNGDGRNVITSPQAGIMAVRAMPDELRQVEKFLKAAQLAVERQVMLEAKIVEVELRDGYQSGVDWSALKTNSGITGGLGVLSGNTTSNTLVRGVSTTVPGFNSTTPTTLASGIALPNAGGGLFALALAAEGFQGVLGFLETQGDVQTLSNPRVATLNNQKAVLKVGTDDFFVTNIMGGSSTNTVSTTTANTISMPTISLQQFFSGISLDVTPQVDDGNMVTLHVHPSVTNVSEITKQIDLGAVGNYRLPLASSSVNETDTMVRIPDGTIVAIGGLMQAENNRSAAGLPGTSGMGIFSSIFGNKSNAARKREVIVLIKPTIIRTALDWESQNQRNRAALDEMDTARARIIRLDGSAAEGSAK